MLCEAFFFMVPYNKSTERRMVNWNIIMNQTNIFRRFVRTSERKSQFDTDIRIVRDTGIHSINKKEKKNTSQKSTINAEKRSHTMRRCIHIYNVCMCQLFNPLNHHLFRSLFIGKSEYRFICYTMVCVGIGPKVKNQRTKQRALTRKIVCVDAFGGFHSRMHAMHTNVCLRIPEVYSAQKVNWYQICLICGERVRVQLTFYLSIALAHSSEQHVSTWYKWLKCLAWINNNNNAFYGYELFQSSFFVSTIHEWDNTTILRAENKIFRRKMLSLSMRFICSLFDLVGTEEYVVRKCTNEPSQAWQVGKLASRSGSVYLEGARHHAQHKLWNECGNRGSGYYLHYFAFHFRTHGVAHRGLAVNTECVYTKIASECYAYVSNELHAHFYQFSPCVWVVSFHFTVRTLAHGSVKWTKRASARRQ